VAGVTVGDRDKLDQVSHLSKFGGRAGGADIAVIRMSPEGDDTNLIILSQHESGAGQGKQQESTHGLRL
jgi:hypothetical protein